MLKKYNVVIIALLVIIWIVTPFITISQIPFKNPKSNSYTLDVIESSPSNFEINNGTVLFSGAINSVTPQGRLFKEKHSKIAENTVTEIEQLGRKLDVTRELNQTYLDKLAVQLKLWKDFTDQNPNYKNILSRELQVFNTATDFQMQENARWAVIDNVKKELEKLDSTEPGPVSSSMTKSTLYTDLLLYYIDLIDFYKTKYKEVITLSTLSHATQENPNLGLPTSFLAEIKPYHEKELKSAETLIYDLDDNFTQIKDIESKANELRGFYKEVNKYSIQEINKIIEHLDRGSQTLTPSTTNFMAHYKMDPLIDSYKNYYKDLKQQLEEQVISEEIREATVIAYYDQELTKLAYTGMLHPGLEYSGIGDWASSAWSAVKTGTKVVSGAAFATVDYATSKASDTLFEVTDKAQAMYNHGVFTDEYNKWSQAYDKAGQSMPTATIENTFVDPLIATLNGDDKNGLGQGAVNKAQGSFSEMDKYLADKTGSNFLSQVAMNTVTCGGYGLAKDFTTINDANATTGQKLVAGAGIALALAPVLSGAKAANEGTKGTIKAATTSYESASSGIRTAVANSNAASGALKNATQNLANATDDMIRAAGPNFQNADILNSAFNSVATKFDDAVLGSVQAQRNLLGAQQQLNSAIASSLTQVPKDTLAGSIKSSISGFISDHTAEAIGGRLSDLYQNSLSQTIKNSEPFFAATVGNSVGINDLANFTLTNFVNNNVTGGITTLMGTILDDKSNNTNKNPNSQQTQTPHSVPTAPDQPPLDPTSGGVNPNQHTTGLSSNPPDQGQQNSPTINSQPPATQAPPPTQVPPPQTTVTVNPVTNQSTGQTPANPFVPQTGSNQPPYGANNQNQQHTQQIPQQGAPGAGQQPGYGTNTQQIGQNPPYGPVQQPPYNPNYVQPVQTPLYPYPMQNPQNFPPQYPPYNPWQQYVQSQQNQNDKTNINVSSAIDDLLNMQQQNQQNFDQNRGQQNSNPYIPNNNNPSNTFSTDLTGGTGNSLTQHIQNLSNQTAGPKPTPRPTYQPQPTTPTNPGNNPSVDIGNGIPETNTTNGIDDDNDGVIDEGSSNGTCQIGIMDTGGIKDDQWDVKVDGSSIGRNTAGKTRWWDLNLSRGQHSVSATGVKVPDNNGTYTIQFIKCVKTGGPALKGSNLNEGQTLTWTISVP